MEALGIPRGVPERPEDTRRFAVKAAGTAPALLEERNAVAASEFIRMIRSAVALGAVEESASHSRENLVRPGAPGLLERHRVRVTVHRPPFELPGRVPEHPLVAAGGDEGVPDAALLRGTEVFADPVGEIQDGLDERAELLAAGRREELWNSAHGTEVLPGVAGDGQKI